MVLCNLFFRVDFLLSRSFLISLISKNKHTTGWISGKVTSDFYGTNTTICTESSSVTSPGTGNVTKCCQTDRCNAIGNLTLPISDLTLTTLSIFRPNSATLNRFNNKLLAFVILFDLFHMFPYCFHLNT